MNEADNPDFEKLFNSSLTYNPGNLLSTHRKLEHVVFQNRETVDSIFVHVKQSSLLVTSHFVKYLNNSSGSSSGEFSFIDEFYNNNSSSIMWLKTRKAKIYSQNFRNDGDIITLICSYPLSSTGKDSKGLVAVNIREDVLNNYLVKFNSLKFGQLMIIIDSNGNVISHSNKASLYRDLSEEGFIKRIIHSESSESFTAGFDNNEHVISYTKSKINDWYYVSLIPTDLFFKKSYALRQQIIIISLIILLVSLVFTNIFSFKIYMPYKRIIGKYSPATGSKKTGEKNVSEDKQIDNMFSNMSDKIGTLQATLDKNTVMIRNNVLNELLYGRIPDEAELDDLLKLSNITFSKQFYCAIVFKFQQTTESNNPQQSVQYHKYSIIEFINDMKKRSFISFPIITGINSISVIINTESDNHSIIEDFVNEVEAFTLNNNFNCYLTSGTGNFVDDLQSLNESYSNARNCLNYKFIRPHQYVFYYHELSSNIVRDTLSEFGYSERFKKLLNLENYNEIQNMLNEFISIISQRNISYRAVRKQISEFINLYKNYLSSLNMNIEKMDDETTINKLVSPDNIYEFVESLLVIVQKTFDNTSSKKHNRNTELVEKVKQNVQNNLASDISLESTADAFNMSKFYLSKLFKEETGDNYIDYVVKCKMNKATELLCSTKLSVKDITDRVGYSHPTYFTRKFKEFTGKTPDQFRKDQRKTPAEETL